MSSLINNMKIVILEPEVKFNSAQKDKLKKLGQVIFANPNDYSTDELVKLCQDADILGPGPDGFGGFEKAKENLNKLLVHLPKLKGLALPSTSYGWVDIEYCRQRHLPVSNIPHYSRESVAEHSFALLLCLAKRIIETDRLTQKGQYQLQMGFELKDKTLGIIGLGSIGSRVAELGLAVGMKVIAYNRSRKKQKGVDMKSFKEVLKQSDALSIHLTDCEATRGIIGKKEISLMKKGVILVNTADRSMVDEKGMAKALKARKISGYAAEVEDLENTPLVKINRAILIRGFGWYTKEALNNLVETWIDNIEKMIKGKPQNLVSWGD
ncbi:hypothetical protein HY345_01115 [Candidatus Microgenomates bacterium]|nr:hypothetical protein [Candidatus Microgenomates bacterium]